jgi:hypothetical protein
MGNRRGTTSSPRTVRLSDGSIVVMDETGGAYPISQAIAAWGIPGMREGSCTPGTARCIVVRTVGSLPAPGRGAMTEGRTTWSQPGQATVRLSAQTPTADRLHVATHELGHALGLTHSTGVMAARDDHRSTTPTAAQRAAALRNATRR